MDPSPPINVKAKPETETFLGWLRIANVHQWIALGNALVLPNDILKGRVTYGFDQDEGQNYPTPCQKKKKMLCTKAVGQNVKSGIVSL